MKKYDIIFSDLNGTLIKSAENYGIDYMDVEDFINANLED